MKCLRCRSELTAGRFVFEDEYRDTPVAFEADGFRCPNCAFQTVKASQSAEYARAASDAYRKLHGHMTSEALRAARAEREMSLERFSQFTGVSIATLKRAEWGHAQDAKTDAAIRRALNPVLLERAVFDGFWKLAQFGGTLELTSLSCVTSESARAVFAAFDAYMTLSAAQHAPGGHTWRSFADLRTEHFAPQLPFGAENSTRSDESPAVAADTTLALAA